MKTSLEEITRVVFRKWKKPIDDGILALFPDIKSSSNGPCLSYAHIGQHGGADYCGCINASRPATSKEYAALKRELEGRGYHFHVVKRFTPKRR